MPARRWSRCCRRAISRSASSWPSRCAPGFRSTRRVDVSCDGCPPDLHAKISFIARDAEFTPPVIFSREQRAEARLSGRGAARGRRGQAHRRPAGDGDARAEPASGAAMKEIAIDVDGPDQELRRRATVVTISACKCRKGEIYGFLGPNGSGKTTTHPHAVRAAHARCRPGHLPRLRHPHPEQTRSSAMSAT